MKRLLGIVLALILATLATNTHRASAQVYGQSYLYGGQAYINGPGVSIPGQAWDLTMYLPTGYYVDWVLTNSASGSAWTPANGGSGFTVSFDSTVGYPDYGKVTLHYLGYTFWTQTGWEPSTVQSVYITSTNGKFGIIPYTWLEGFGTGQYNSNPNVWCGYYWGQCTLSQPIYFYGSCGWYYGYCDYYAPYYFAWDYTNYCYCLYGGMAYQYGQYQGDEALNDDSLLTYNATPEAQPPRGVPAAPSHAAFMAKLHALTKGDKTTKLAVTSGGNQHFDKPQPATPKQ